MEYILVGSSSDGSWGNGIDAKAQRRKGVEGINMDAPSTSSGGWEILLPGHFRSFPSIQLGVGAGSEGPDGVLQGCFWVVAGFSAGVLGRLVICWPRWLIGMSEL